MSITPHGPWNDDVHNVTKRMSDTTATFMIMHISWAREMSAENTMHSQCRCEISKAITSQFHEKMITQLKSLATNT